MYGQCTHLLTGSFSLVSRKPLRIYFVPLMIVVAPKIGLGVDQSALNSVTRGLVGDSSFAVLPNVSPKTTFAITLLFQTVGVPTLRFETYN